VKKFPHFMQLEISSPCSQEPSEALLTIDVTQSEDVIWKVITGTSGDCASCTFYRRNWAYFILPLHIRSVISYKYLCMGGVSLPH
jgi:hypothetical protein